MAIQSAGAPEALRDKGGSETYASEERLSKVLDEAGIQEPESCKLMLDILNAAGSKDPEERLVAVFQLRQCIVHLQKKKEKQVLVNLVVFALEKGVIKQIASGFREAARGDWAYSLPEMAYDLSSTSSTKMFVNKPLVYAHCLADMTIDVRCAAFILKEFPDVAKVAAALFVANPADSTTWPRSYDFRKATRGGIMKLLVYLMPRSNSLTRKVAEITAFLKEVLQFAASVKEGTTKVDAKLSFGAMYLVHFAAVSNKADLLALRTTIYELVENILANSRSRDQIDVACKLLFKAIQADLDEPRLSDVPSLGSSLLALHAVKDKIGEDLHRFAFFAAQAYWMQDFAKLTHDQFELVLIARFSADQRAFERAGILHHEVFSEPSGELADIYLLETRKERQRTESAGTDVKLPAGSPKYPVMARLNRRKCSQHTCRNVEPVAGTFLVCGKCKIAVYCSRGKKFTCPSDRASLRPSLWICNRKKKFYKEIKVAPSLFDWLFGVTLMRSLMIRLDVVSSLSRSQQN